VNDTLTLVVGGDVAPVRQPVDRLADLIAPAIADRDFLIGQCERTYSTRGAYQDWATVPGGKWSRLDLDYASVWQAAGINVASVASNHALDWGLEPFLDTIELFRSWGMQVVGGGASEEEARRPVLMEANGVTVALLAYNCVLRDGQRASGDHPGMSAVRCRTWYEPIDHQPGTPPLVHSAPLDSDLADMTADIEAARKVADSVVAYVHWGLRHTPKVISTYQPLLGHAAIDAGADIVIGHGPHVVKGLEVYQGRAIFYSIGNFLTTGRLKQHGSGTQEWNVTWVEHNQDPEVLYAFPAHARHGLLPRLSFTSSGLAKVEVIPTWINDLAQPRALTADEPEFAANLAYLEWASDQLEHNVRVEGDVFVVDATTA
jgi:poly-gamma-glutamate synthesis protein (capsule biosynthesis protein)